MEKLTFEDLPTAVNQISEKLVEIERLLIHQSKDQPTQQLDQLLTVQQAADFLTLSVPTIYTKVSKGELPVMKRSKRLYFSNLDLINYLKAGRKKTSLEIEAEASSYVTLKKRRD